MTLRPALPAPGQLPSFGGLLAEMQNHWRSRGWDPADLTRFRMGPEDDAWDALDDDDRDAIESMSDDDRKALAGLSDDDRKALRPPPEDPRVKQARDQAAKQRLELKPWKELGKELGMTPEQVRDALKAAKKNGTGGSGDDDKDKPDADDIARQARLDADAKANQKVVKAEVKAVAADLFADPGDAHLYVDITKYDVDDDGDLVDPDELVSDLKDVLKRKPHLAKKAKKPEPDKAQGKGGSTKTFGEGGKAEAERRFAKQKAGAGAK